MASAIIGNACYLAPFGLLLWLTVYDIRRLSRGPRPTGGPHPGPPHHPGPPPSPPHHPGPPPSPPHHPGPPPGAAPGGQPDSQGSGPG